MEDRRMRVLLLDNDLDFQRSFARRLGEVCPAACVEAVATVAEAGARLLGGRVDALFVDDQLGGDDENASALRFAQRVRDLGIAVPLAILGERDTGVWNTAVRVGAQAWLAKSELEVTDLRALLERMTGDPRPEPAVHGPGLPDPAVEALVHARMSELTAHRAHSLAAFAQAALRSSSCAREARRHGLARTTLQPFARLARWSENELAELLGRRGARGGRLTISHLQLTARLPAGVCEGMNARIVEEGLTVRQLRSILRVGAARGSVSPRSRPSRTPECSHVRDAARE
jgi:hypothetical protein